MIGALDRPQFGGYKAPMIFLGACNLAAATLLLGKFQLEFYPCPIQI